MKTFTRNILLCISLLMCLVSAVNAAPLTMSEAINKAGHQRMLTQRIVKTYALVGQKAMLSANMQLRDSITLFESQLQELRRFAATPEEKKSIAEISNLWKTFKKKAVEKPDMDVAPELDRLSEELLEKAHYFVLLLQKRSGTNLGKLVNLSGRQRMLSQRIAKFYVLTSWGIKNPEYSKKMKHSITEFTDALRTLKQASENTPEIDAALSDVEKNWATFTLSTRLKGGRFTPSLVVRSLDKILDQMNGVTALYAAIDK